MASAGRTRLPRPDGVDWNALAILSPFESAGVSLAVVGVALAMLTDRIHLHFVGVIVAAALAIGERGEVRWGGFLGLLGGLLVVAAGAYSRATRRHL